MKRFGIRMSMFLHPLLALLFTVLICPGGTDAEGASSCSSLSDWKGARGSPEVRQVDSRTALLDWSELWSARKWAGCVRSVRLVVMQAGREEVEMEVESPETSRNMTVGVEPCQETRFLVKVVLSGGGGEVSSFRSRHGFKTHLAPMAKPTEALRGAAVVRGARPPGDGDGPIDLTTAEVKVSFGQVVEDPGCRKVVAAELRFRKVQEENEDGVWTVAKTISKFRRRLEETLTGLDDLCSDYEVALELTGTEGTGGALAR